MCPPIFGVLLQLHWLYWAYRLEWQGHDVFLQLWMASCVFCVAHFSVAIAIARGVPAAVKLKPA